MAGPFRSSGRPAIDGVRVLWRLVAVRIDGNALGRHPADDGAAVAAAAIDLAGRRGPGNIVGRWDSRNNTVFNFSIVRAAVISNVLNIQATLNDTIFAERHPHLGRISGKH